MGERAEQQGEHWASTCNIFLLHRVAKKEKENHFNDLKDVWTDPLSPAAAARGGDEGPEGGPGPGHSVVHSAGSGPDCSPSTRSQTPRYLRCPLGLGTSTSGTNASQIVLQALCSQANPGRLTTP